MTRDRVGAALIIVAAIVGLVLVLSTPESDDDDDDGPAGDSPSVSRVETPDGPAQPIEAPDADDDD